MTFGIVRFVWSERSRRTRHRLTLNGNRPADRVAESPKMARKRDPPLPPNLIRAGQRPGAGPTPLARDNITVLLDSLDDNQVRQWYAAQDVQHGWSRSVLRHHIDSGRHLRVGAAPTTRKGANGALPGEWSDGGDVRCLWSLGALAHGVGDLLILLKGSG